MRQRPPEGSAGCFPIRVRAAPVRGGLSLAKYLLAKFPHEPVSAGSWGKFPSIPFATPFSGGDVFTTPLQPHTPLTPQGGVGGFLIDFGVILGAKIASKSVPERRRSDCAKRYRKKSHPGWVESPGHRNPAPWPAVISAPGGIMGGEKPHTPFDPSKRGRRT